jgi:ABC-2 type transport system ATP-binding protein
LIEVENLVKRYGDRNVVDHLSFSVEEGQIVGFLGPNGAGKSTTMNIITGYISATEGSVKINGYDIVEEPEKAKALIGYLPEQPPLYPDMYVREYLSFVCDLKGVKKAEKEKNLTKVMRMTRISDVSGRLIKHLSKGYKQRVGLAAALIGTPKILILDEPTVGLDPKQILEMRDLIRELSKNHTILLSSHIMQEVSAVCNQILIINEGKLVLADKPEDIAKHVEQTNDVILQVKGEKEKISSVLEKVENVEEFHVTDTEETGICRAEVTSLVENDVRESLFYGLADAKCAILEMVTKEPTLEEAFISLTGEGSQQHGGLEKKKRGKKEEE